MTLRELTIEEFKEHSGNYDSQSFLQTPEMAKLLENAAMMLGIWDIE